jgi:F-type H+-transporting ATPase subunit b
MQKRKLVTRLAALFLLASMSLAVPAALAQDATTEATAAATQAAEVEETTEAPVGVITSVPAESATEVHTEAETEGEGAEPAEHGEESAAVDSNPLTPLGINLGLLCVHLLNFGMLVGVLGALVWKPAVGFLDSRRAEIQKGLEDAAAAARARQNAEAEAEKVLAEARAGASREIAEARTRGEDVAKTIQSDARTEAERALATARSEAETVKTTELSGMREQVIQVAVALAGRIIQENLDGKKQSALVSDFLTRLPATPGGLTGQVEVTSALPLSDAEQTQVKTKLGAQNVTFRVDPTILGGLVVKSQDRVIDGSARSNLNDLSSRLS